MSLKIAQRNILPEIIIIYGWSMKLISGHNDKFDLFFFFFILFNLFYSSLQTYKNMSNKIEIFENLSVYFLDSHTMYIENMRPVKNSRWSVISRYTNLRIVWSHTWCMITYVRKILPASRFMSDTFKIYYMCVPPFN